MYQHHNLRKTQNELIREAIKNENCAKVRKMSEPTAKIWMPYMIFKNQQFLYVFFQITRFGHWSCPLNPPPPQFGHYPKFSTFFCYGFPKQSLF